MIISQYQYNKWQKLGFPSQGTRHRTLLEYIANADKENAVRTLREDIASFDTTFLG